LLRNIRLSDRRRRSGGVGDKRPSFPFETVLFGLFLSIALLMLTIALVSGALAAQLVAGQIYAPGYVTALTPRREPDGALLYDPVVTFTLSDGRRAIVQTSAGSAPSAYTVDDAITVVFAPDDPAGARIASPIDNLANWIVTLVTAILAAAFLLAAYLARRLAM
jgi:hypothetical protein